MINRGPIDNYTERLARMLSKIPELDRVEIVDEIRAHLEYRAKEGRLEDAIRALGPPHLCARGFLDELKLQEAFTDGGMTKTFGALISLASRRLWATTGLFISAIFFAFAIGFAFTAVVKIAAPELAGFWLGADRGDFLFGVSPSKNSAGMTDVLGYWLVPIVVALGVLNLVFGQRLGRYFVVRMVNSKRKQAANIII